MKASLLSDEVAMLEILHHYQFIDPSEQSFEDLTFQAQVNEKLNEGTAHCKPVENMLREGEEGYGRRFENADALDDTYFHWHFGKLNKDNQECSLSRSIYLLPTAVMMSQIRGRKLAERLAASPQHAHDLPGVLDAGIAFLEKPSMPDSLVIKMRKVLEAPAKGLARSTRYTKQLTGSRANVQGFSVDIKT